ncbi:hypothetical protein E4T44_10368, partial [Aureobasidium sp. EXF-8845]
RCSSCVQSFKVPQALTGYGGVSFSPTRDLVSGPMTTLSRGPFETYAQLYRAFFEQQLAASDTSPVLQGWQDDGLRVRLTRFCAEQLPDMTSRIEGANKAIVHSDFTMNNMLVDETTGILTALLDYDWSFIGSIQDEFLRSFCDLGMIPGPDTHGDDLALRQSLLLGIDHGQYCKEQIDPLLGWYKILQTRGARIPSGLPGMEDLSQLHWLVDQITPWLLTHEVPLKRRTKEQLDAVRAKTKQTICAFLDSRGL